MKKLAIMALLAGVAGLGFYWKDYAAQWLSAYLGSEDDQAVPVTKASKRDYAILVPAQGELTGLKTTPILTPQVRGSLKIGWLADEGAIVEEGDLLVRFDNTDALLSLEQNQNDLSTFDRRIDRSETDSESLKKQLGMDREQAEIEVNYAENQIRHDESVFSRQQIQESIVSASLANFKRDAIDYKGGIRDNVSRADLQILEIDKGKSQAEVDEAQRTLSSLEIRSPVPGVVLYGQRGLDRMKVGAEVWPGLPIIEVAALHQFQGEIYVVENEINGVESGRPVDLTIAAFPGRAFMGEIQQVAKAPEQRSRRDPRKYFACKVLLDVPIDDMRRMKSGIHIEGEIQLSGRKASFVLPKSAVIKQADDYVVFLRQGKEFVEQSIEIVDSDHGFYLVEGLEDGQWVALRHPFQEQNLQLPDFNAPGRSSSRRFVIFN